MIPSHHWARNLTISKADIEFLTGRLMEIETPLTTEELARILVEERLQQETTRLQERFRDVQIYNPSQTYTVGQRLAFPKFDYETAHVVHVRAGDNPEYGEFSVIGVRFDNPALNPPGSPREFAAALTTPHVLSQSESNGAGSLLDDSEVSADAIFAAVGDDLIRRLEAELSKAPDLLVMARRWFPRDLLLEANVGHLNLAEAVLDMHGGGPLPTEAILNEIGGLGNAPLALQVFSLNYALREDDRFDEVGPTGEVLWFLTRLEPVEVRQIPALLQYTPINSDTSLLTPEMLALEAEIGDELSPLPPQTDITEGHVTLIYPHRRLGTLPLNASTITLFPTARQTPRVWVTLIDGQDGEEYQGWVVRKERYVYGLAKFFRKHKLPIGAQIVVRRSEEEGKVIVDFNAHRPRTEYVRLIVIKGDQISFENHKRAIGAVYDELMILGADDPAAVDALYQSAPQQRRSLFSILRQLIPSLGVLNPQGTVHAKTLYSAVNVLRRCPPGPILATLAAHLEFENVGGHYWKLRTD